MTAYYSTPNVSYRPNIRKISCKRRRPARLKKVSSILLGTSRARAPKGIEMAPAAREIHSRPLTWFSYCGRERNKTLTSGQYHGYLFPVIRQAPCLISCNRVEGMGEGMPWTRPAPSSHVALYPYPHRTGGSGGDGQSYQNLIQ
jgi:hypothetical protein